MYRNLNPISATSGVSGASGFHPGLLIDPDSLGLTGGFRSRPLYPDDFRRVTVAPEPGGLPARRRARIDDARLAEPAKGEWRMQARRRRAQMPVPKLVDGNWKVWFRIDEERPDGTIARVQRTKILGREGDMTKAEAKRAAAELVRSINNVEEGIEHRRKTVTGLMEAWDMRIKETLKFSTQLSYAWAFQRMQRAFGHVAVQDIGKADVQAFLTAASRELSPESVRDLRARLSGLFTVAETWGWIQPGSNPAKGRLSLPEKRPKRKKILLTPATFHTLVMAL